MSIIMTEEKKRKGLIATTADVGINIIGISGETVVDAVRTVGGTFKATANLSELLVNNSKIEVIGSATDLAEAQIKSEAALFKIGVERVISTAKAIKESEAALKKAGYTDEEVKKIITKMKTDNEIL